MLQAIRNAFRLPDLRRKILITFGILVAYRLAAHVPIPGVNAEALRQLFATNQLLGLLDMFSGGAMSSFSVIAMGVSPYITATIILQLLTPVIPRMAEMMKEDREKLNRWGYILTVPLAALQGYAVASQLARAGSGQALLANFGLRDYPLATIATLATLAAGTMFAVWLGDLITEQGIGNGTSLIIFAGIVAGVPQRVGGILISSPQTLIVFLLVTVVTVVTIVVVQEGQRRIPVQYGRRVRAMRGQRLRVVGGQSTHIPLKVNSAGMIPLIFAQSFLLFPGNIASYFLYSETPWIANVANAVYTVFNPQGNVYWIIYFIAVVGLTYFYTDVVFRQQNLPETLQRQGGFIPGIRPGKRTADYLNKVMTRITLVGAVFLGLVSILPWLTRGAAGAQQIGAMLISSSGLLIVVGVVLDTMKQLEAQLLMRHYEGFIK
ncbi:MAG: preprotein translocase subunit SecY [Chloroflexi bacterium]|nr:preprotein translocase subunit SecY [Chloroflexota bacterium]